MITTEEHTAGLLSERFSLSCKKLFKSLYLATEIWSGILIIKGYEKPHVELFSFIKKILFLKIVLLKKFYYFLLLFLLLFSSHTQCCPGKPV